MINMQKLLIFIGIFLGSWLFLMPFLNITGGFWTAILFTVAITLTLDFFGKMKLFPFPLKKNIAFFLMAGIWVWGIFMAGWFSGLLGGIGLPGTGAAVTGVFTEPSEITSGACAVTEEIHGKSATMGLNAWNLESNTPYSAAVDLGADCWVFKNGNSPTDFTNNTDDTSGGSITGFSGGDTLYMYCGGSSYYTEPLEGFCVDDLTPSVNLNAHQIITHAGLAITGYDDTGGTALTAESYNGDYYITQGAGGEDSIYIKLKANLANRAYQFCAWCTVKYYNVSEVIPQGEEGTYTPVVTPQHMKALTINRNNTDNENTTETYDCYRLAEPILMQEWDSIKEQFVVEADDTNDPWYNPASAKQNGFAIIAKDCTYSRGGDGKIYLDFYTHDTAQSDVGLDEEDHEPWGKDSGVTIADR
jgi:hypothetical protein